MWVQLIIVLMLGSEEWEIESLLELTTRYRGKYSYKLQQRVKYRVKNKETVGVALRWGKYGWVESLLETGVHLGVNWWVFSFDRMYVKHGGLVIADMENRE